MERYPNEKICPSCQTQKQKGDFRFQHSNPDGLNKHCNDCLKKGNRAKKPRKKVTYEQNRRYNIKRKFGITQDDFNSMLQKQGGCCAICKNPSPTPSKPGAVHGFVVDHCHDSGHVRAILCHRCNKAIGFMDDDPSVAQNAAKYLFDWMVAQQ